MPEQSAPERPESTRAAASSSTAPVATASVESAPTGGAASLGGPSAVSLPPSPPDLGPDDRERLLELTRIALGYATGKASLRDLDEMLHDCAEIGQPAACFVTLTEHDELRGCMGNLDTSIPLAESVVAAAIMVIRHDPRFLPVVASELPYLHVEISVLGESVSLPDPDDFRPGIDGVIVDRGGRRALLLPEVATDQGWGATEMFDTVCRKAGLRHDAWRESNTRLVRFRTIRWGGSAVHSSE